MAEQPLLSPFPDALVLSPNKAAAVAYLMTLPIPGRFRRRHLRRWSDYTGVPTTAEESDLVGGGPYVPEG